MKAVPEDSDLYGIILHDMAACHVIEGDREEAINKIKQAMNVYENNSLKIGKARVHIALLNAYVYFGERPNSFQNPGILENEFINGMKVCSSKDLILLVKDQAYLKNSICLTDIKDIEDPYGASKAHCQYSWALLESNPQKALWHAKYAYEYSKLIEDAKNDTIWGLRDGIVGKYWKQNVALYTIGDCYVKLKDFTRRLSDNS